MSAQDINESIKHMPHALLCAAEESPITCVATGILAHTISLESSCLHDYSIKKMPAETPKQLFELILDLEDATLTNQQLYQKILSLSDKSLQQLLYQAITHALQRPAEEVLKENPRLLLQLTTQKGTRLLYGPDFLRNPDPISTLLQEVAQVVLHSELPLLLTNRQQAEEEICKTLAQKFMEHLIPADRAFRNLSFHSSVDRKKEVYQYFTEACRSLNTKVASIENEWVRYFIVREVVAYLSDFLYMRTSDRNDFVCQKLQELTNLVVDNLSTCSLSRAHILDILKFAIQQNDEMAELWSSRLAIFDLSGEERYVLAMGIATSENKDVLITAVKNFHLSHKELVAVAIGFLQKSRDVFSMIDAIENFAPAGTKEYEHILLKCASLKSEYIYENRAHYTLSSLAAAKIELLHAFFLLSLPENYHNLNQFESFSQAAKIEIKSLPPLSLHIQQLFEEAKASESAQKIQSVQQTLFASAYVYLQQQGVAEALLLENSNILYTLSVYRPSQFAIKMVRYFCENIINDPDALKRYHRLATHVHVREIATMLHMLGCDVLDKKNPINPSAYDVNKLHSFLTSKDVRTVMRDVAKNYIPSIINAIMLLGAHLEEKDIAPLLNNCAEGEFLTLDAFLANLSLSGVLCACHKTQELLEALSQSNKSEALTACFLQALQEIVDLKDIDNLGERYQQTFGALRIPNALPTYIGGLMREGVLPDVREALMHMIRGVLMGTLPADRYKFDTQHLKMLREGTPEIFDQWQHNSIPQPIDLQSFINYPKRDQEKLILVETDHPLDLFLCGSEIMGSCLRIDGDVAFNKCLLGYVLDGKTKMLAIKDLSGQVIGRCMLRLLIHKETKQPVLVQEWVYANRPGSIYEKILNRAAEQRAASLGIRLGRNIEFFDEEVEVGSESSEEKVQVCSLGCPAPFDYEDGSGCVMEGPYTFFTKLVPLME